ncbi:MAG TPA: hypothetical protein DCS55_01635 [Acidimicrobiaceae bacterium]|nr:hypothetical protein [Acidimicrobiaceae bacterium]
MLPAVRFLPRWTGVEPGLGNAYAQGVKVDPRSGRPSFGITYGTSLAGHQNTIAIAEARTLGGRDQRPDDRAGGRHRDDPAVLGAST